MLKSLRRIPMQIQKTNVLYIFYAYCFNTSLIIEISFKNNNYKILYILFTRSQKLFGFDW